MGLPEPAQCLQGNLGKRHKSVLAAFGIADVNTVTLTVDIANLHLDTLAQAQPHAVNGQKKYAIAQLPSGIDDLECLSLSEDVGQATNLRRLDDLHPVPGLVQHMPVEELNAAGGS